MTTFRRQPGEPSAEDLTGYSWPVSVQKLAAAESPEQQMAIDALLSSLRELARLRGWKSTFIGSHTFFSWRQDDPLKRMAPDVYLLDDPPSPFPRSWKTWLPGHKPPRWAAEVVSEDWGKDYQEAPGRYDELGCPELVVFDPAAATGRVRNPARAGVTLYRRGPDGAFARLYAGPGPVFSEQLQCWVRPDTRPYVAELRLSEDEEGARPIATEAERLEIAEARIRELETRLRDLTSGRRPK